MSTLSDLVLDLFVKDDYRALLRLSKKVDSDTKLESMCLIMRGIRDLETLCGQNTINHKFTPAQRKSYAAVGHFIGTQQVMFYCSELPVINDPQLVRYGLKTLNQSDAWLVRSHAIQSIKARQIEISHILIEWLIKQDPNRYGYHELYLMYEASIFDGKSDPWIFNKLYEMGLVPSILKFAEAGKIGICKEFLDDLKQMNKEKLTEVLLKVSGNSL
ncbi:hypothetical protein N7335_01980 [Stutzerimonas stutzeri]|uniref:Uncharacterized protein n=1 Tax=Stutzerimonas stutzeri TaxID=316 RepID=A0AA42H6L3_STUST|nr:hypothetical protein [Stutzerimonas stutzeri]MDH0145155.1 hypothetical protein [Stutzerimonas stutzeri]MDH0149590.1 hypothetical protein [Stutzerimonas stutzeri]